MRKRRLAVVVLLVCAAILGCGSKLYLNSNYEYHQPGRDLKLALIPAAGNDGTMLDSLFTLIFDDSSRSQILVRPGEIRNELSTDSALLTVVNKMLKAEYSKDNLKSGVNLKNTLTAGEYALLSNGLGNPDIVLVPVVFGIKSLGVVTSGFSRVRLFDIRDGSLIYENSLDLNVELGGDEGRVYMALGLIGFAKDDYIEHFWTKYIEEW